LKGKEEDEIEPSTISYIKRLASRTRYAGTEGEREAYERLFAEFKGLKCDVEKDETEYIKNEKYKTGVSLLVFWIFGIFIAASWFVHPLTLAILLLIFFLFTQKALPRIELMLARTKSLNIVASMNTEKTHRLILCGHYDSSRVMGKFAQKHWKTFMKVEPIMTLFYYIFVIILNVKGIYTLVIDGFAFTTLIGLAPRMVGPWAIYWSVYLAAYCATMFAVTVVWSGAFTKEFSYGADDNASGIAVMLETARRFSSRKLDLRVDFACFAAEERGLFGSRKWVNKHGKEMDRDRTFVLNLDCVGRGDKFFVTKGLGSFFKKRSDPALYSIITSVLDKLGLPFEECWGGSSDHAAFIEKNFRTCAIYRCNVEKANIAALILRKMFRIPINNKVVSYNMDWIHTEKDTVENIDERKLEETVSVVCDFIDALNSSIGTGTLNPTVR
jgi:hypothetical protein